MKNNNYAVLIIVGLVVLALGLLFWVGGSESRERRRWETNYDRKGNDPYDLAAFYNLLKATYQIEPNKERVIKSIPINSDSSSLYLFIGTKPRYTEREAEHLLKYAENGGQVFIACQSMPDSLMQFLYYFEDCGFDPNFENNGRGGWLRYTLSDSIDINLNHPKLKFAEDLPAVFERNTNAWNRSDWGFFPISQICDQTTYPIAVLGTLRYNDSRQFGGDEPLPADNTEANFIRFQVKKGYVYIHTNPQLFTNYFMRYEMMFDYANHVLSHFNPSSIYWDEVSREEAEKPKRAAPPRPTGPQRNPMEYVYSQTALRNAWYLLLGAGLLYMIFGAKRRQRAIPILEPNRNTSLEFVETVGRLYYQQQNHKVIFQKLMQHFLAHIRQRYHLVTRDLDAKLIEKICVRADAPKEVVAPIFEKYQQLNQQLQNRAAVLSTEALNDFYYLVERFHRFEQNNIFNEQKRQLINGKSKAKPNF